MYLDDKSKIYGCWRCGEIMGDYREDSINGNAICESCGEPAIVTFVASMDLLNSLYLRGVFDLESMADEYDIEIEIEMDDGGEGNNGFS